MIKSIDTVGYCDFLKGVSIPLESVKNVSLLKNTITVLTICNVEIPMVFRDSKEAQSALKSIKSKLFEMPAKRNHRDE